MLVHVGAIPSGAEVMVNKIGWLLALLILLVGCGGPRTNIGASAPPSTDAADVTEPTGLSIPSIGVDVNQLDTVGVDTDGDYRCPADPNTVAWNRSGIVPGEPGLALIVASAAGPFRRLDELRPGDLVYVTRADGTKLTFKAIDVSPKASSAVLQLAGCGERTGAAKYAELAAP